MTVELITEPKFFVVGQFFYNGEWDGENWITLTKIEFTINLEKFTIPAGFVTDFASVPRIARGVVNRIGRGVIAYVIHDWLRKDIQQEISTKTSDKALYKFMRLLGESRYNSKKVYYGLRMFGWAVTIGPNQYSLIDPEVIEYINKSNLYIKVK